MKVQTACLSSGEMERFLQSHLSADRMVAAEEHITSCETCMKVMHELAGDAAWWSDVELALSQESAFQAESYSEHEKADLNQEEADERSEISGLLEMLGPTDHPQMLGRIGSYEIVGLIGQGGMGAVFKAFDAGLNRYVAIKLLLPHLAVSEAARKRFRREGQAAAAVVNDHVLPIYVVDQWRGMPYLVMQYIRGSTVQQRLSAEGPFSVHDVLRIGLHTARGLAAAHAQGLVHRDVKPSNILLDGGVGRAIISDFGLARAADDASLTRSGMLAGTPAFMSPEQIRGERIDARSDLFSLGTILYMMCTGQPPFRAESNYAVMRRITDESPRPIREINPDIPTWLEQLIGLLLAKKADQRPQSAAVVAGLLQQCLAHLEQPHSVSLPNELQNTHVTWFHRNFWRLIMYVSASAIAAVLVWAGCTLLMQAPSLAQNESTEQETRSSEPSAERTAGEAKPAKMKGSTTVDGFKISLEGVGLLGDISEQVVRFRAKRDNRTTTSSSSHSATNNFSTGRTFNNGNGTGGGAGGFGSTSAGGGGAGFAGGGGSSFGYSFEKPTFGIALKISDEKAKGKGPKQRFAELGSAAKIVELDGTVEETKDSGPITTAWPQFDKRFPGTSGLYVPRRKGLDAPLKEIHGELKVSTGRRVEAVFPGTRPQKKKVLGEEFALKSVEHTPEGTSIIVSFPPTTEMKKARNFFERLQMMLISIDAYELEVVDKNGQIHIPSGTSSTGSGGGGMQGFSFNGTTRQQFSQSEPELSILTFRFDSLPAASIKSIVARVVEMDGESETVPFTIKVETE